MDPQTMMIGAAIFVVSAIVIYLISVCSMREKTFEQVLEEQRLQQAEEIKKQRIEKKDKVRRRYPGRGKGKKGEKADEKSATVGLLESESENDRVAEPEGIEPLVEPVQQQQTKSERKNKKDKKKPREEAIPANENDMYALLVNESGEEVVVAQKVVETAEALTHGHRKGKRGGAVQAQKAEQLLEEQIIVETQEVQVREEVAFNGHQTAPDNTKKSKKKPVNGGAGDTVDAVNSSLVQMVKQTVLTESEVILLIEILQAKQGSSAQWTKKSKQTDAITLLKKQLEDKERSFQDEHQLAQNAAQKLRDLRADLARERQRYETLQKLGAERMKGQEQEKDALQARMQQTHEQHSAEVTAMRRQVEASGVSQDQAAMVQRLTEENQKLKEAANQAQAAARQTSNDKANLKMLQEELSKNVVQLNRATSNNKNLEVKMNRTQEKLKAMESAQHETATRQLKEMTEQLHRSDNHNATLVKDLDTARSSSGRMEQELVNVRSRVKDFQAQEGRVRALEQQLQDTMHAKNSLETRFSEMERMSKKTDGELKQLCEENNLLAAQLKESKERTSGEGQEAPAADQSGQMAAPAKPDPRVAQLLDEKEAEISKLKAELEDKLCETTKLSTDLEAQKDKNNALRGKNWKAMDALSKAETKAEGAATLKDNLSSKNLELERLKKELQMAEKHNHELVTKQEAVVVELVQQSTAKKDEQLAIAAELTARSEVIESYKVQLVQKEEQLKEVTTLKEQLAAQAGELGAFAALKAEVAAKEEELRKLVESQQVEVEQLREKLGKDAKSKTEQVEQLTEQLDKLSKQNQELVKSTESSSSQLGAQVEQLTVELASKNTQVCSLQQKITDVEGSLQKLSKDADNAADAARLSAELDTSNQQLQQVTKELEDLRAENQELQIKNKDIIEELQKLKQQAKASSVQQDELQNIKKVLHRMFPDITVSETTKYSEWISIFEQQAPQYIISDKQNGTDHSKELEESQQVQSRLQAQVHQYKDVLADTEGILNKLQSSVEDEETKWRLRVAAAEERNNQLEVEVKSLRDKLLSIEDDNVSLQSQVSEGLANGSSKPQEIEQLKTNLAQTQRQLERELQVNKQLTQRLGAGAESSGDGTSA